MIVKYMYLSNFYRSFHIFIVLLLLLIMCGDIEVNPGPDNNKNLVFSLSNMQSLYANKSDLKLSELQIMANDWHIDVLAVTETWLDSNIPDALVSITGYQKPFRRDRNKRGGGTAIYTAPTIYLYADIDDIVTYWSLLLMQIAAEFIPNTTVTVRAREKPWVNGDLKRLIRRRNVLWRRYRRSRSDAHLNTFNIVRNQVVALNRTLRLNYYTSLGEELSSSDMPNRKWWKTVHQVTGDKVCTSIPPLIENGVSLMNQVWKLPFLTNTLPVSVHNHPEQKTTLYHPLNTRRRQDYLICTSQYQKLRRF